MAATPRSARGLPAPLRIAHAHIKLVFAALLGIVLFFLLPHDLRASARALIAWNVGVLLYLGVGIYLIGRFDLDRVRRRAALEDEGGALILVLTVAAAAASMVAIFAELGSGRHEQAGAFSIALAISTVLLSWTFIHVIFAFHYAHEFYGEAKGDRRQEGLEQDGHDGRRKGGVCFPEDNHPDYWDFVYFSFVIGMTFQVSDVQVTSKRVRRVVVAHGAVAFFYNVAILALTVNIGGEFVK